MYAAEFQRCMIELDVPGIRRVWAHVCPNMPMPETEADTLIALHMARTVSNSIDFKLRAYSHSWLMERSLPSQLPDHMRASADQICPRIVEGVGISVNFRSEWMKPAAGLVRGAMEDAVNDAYAEGRTDPAFVIARMADAKAKEIRKLFAR